MVIVLVPFVGSWTLIIAVFATQQRERKPTRKNHDTLLKKQAHLLILLPALVLHGIGLCGHSWVFHNSNVHQKQGAAFSGSQPLTSFCVRFPSSPCLRNGLLESSFNTPAEEVIAAFLFIFLWARSKQN